jgi:hypothetical protein
VSGHAFAIPSEPPPTGKVWVEIDGFMATGSDFRKEALIDI